MRRSSVSFALAVASLLIVGMAQAQDRTDESFWAAVAHPQRSRHAQLVAEARGLLRASEAHDAAELLEEAVRIDSSDPLGFYFLGKARLREGRYAACADALLVLERSWPNYSSDDAPLDDTLGLCLRRAGRLDEATQHYRRLLAGGRMAIEPRDAHARLGDCYQALGRLEDAIVEYGVAIALDSKYVPAHVGLALAYDRDEQTARATDAMLRALALSSGLDDLRSSAIVFVPESDLEYSLGFGHLVASRTDPIRRAPAIALFRRYLERNPTGPWVERARRHLAELGAAELSAADVVVAPPAAPERALAVQAALGLGVELAKCFGGQRTAAVRIQLSSARAAAQHPREIPRVSAWPMAAPSNQVMECLDKKVQGALVVTQQLLRISLSIVAH